MSSEDLPQPVSLEQLLDVLSGKTMVDRVQEYARVDRHCALMTAAGYDGNDICAVAHAVTFLSGADKFNRFLNDLAHLAMYHENLEAADALRAHTLIVLRAMETIEKVSEKIGEPIFEITPHARQATVTNATNAKRTYDKLKEKFDLAAAVAQS